MARKAKGNVLVRKRKGGTVYALRFTAAGERRYVTLGTAADGWTRQRAEDELRHTMADVERGIWKPPTAEPVQEIDSEQTFHEFSSQWFSDREGEWRPKTRRDYEWKLARHLLPYFARHLLSQITYAEIDRFKAAKVAEADKIKAAAEEGKPIMDEYTDRRGRKTRRPRRPLSVGQVNKTLGLLAAILERAVKYELIDRNPAKGERLKAAKPAAVWLDSAEHIAALLDAAGELDREARADRQVPRRAILATLTLAGLRIGELVELRWRDIDLAAGWLTVRQSKTNASVRRVRLLPTLRDELLTLKTSSGARSADRVFPTQTGGPLNQSNVRNRVLAKAVERANERLDAADSVPLPDGLTPHKLRHTFASLLVALGTDPGVVMDELGHTDPGFTLRVYRHSMRRDPDAREQLQALVGAIEMAPNGTSARSRHRPCRPRATATRRKWRVSRQFP